jgi:hypothetical protein
MAFHPELATQADYPFAHSAQPQASIPTNGFGQDKTGTFVSYAKL